MQKRFMFFVKEKKREVDYFNYFKERTPKIEIIPIPNEKGQSDPVKLKERAENMPELRSKKLRKNKDEVWFVIDTDQWNEKGDRINKLRSSVQAENKHYNGWFVAQSNPSFEIWLYYHYNSKKPDAQEVCNCKSFKEFVANKTPKGGGFDSRRLSDEIILQAIINAKKNFEIDKTNNQPKMYSTEVFQLVEQIINFVKY